MTLKQIVLNKSATSLVKNNTHIQRQGNPTMKFLVWNPLTSLRLQIWLKANQFHLPKPVITWDFPTSTDVIVIKLIPSLSSWGKQEVSLCTHTNTHTHTHTKNTHTKNTHPSYLLPHAFMEDSIRHVIAQMTYTSKAYIPCPLVIIIKWRHMITWNRLQHCYGGR